MAARIQLSDTPLSGLKVVGRRPVGDARGYLERMFCADELREQMAGKAIVSINHTLTARAGTVRGMHYQAPPHAEMKLVSCLRGEVYDVAVDLRRDSTTFLAWYAQILSPGRHNGMLIPEGFAHGFQTLSDDCEMLYLHTASFQPDAERGLNPRDACLAIPWPAEIALVSDRDSGHPLVDDSFEGVRL